MILPCSLPNLYLINSLKDIFSPLHPIPLIYVIFTINYSSSYLYKRPSGQFLLITLNPSTFLVFETAVLHFNSCFVPVLVLSTISTYFFVFLLLLPPSCYFHPHLLVPPPSISITSSHTHHHVFPKSFSQSCPPIRNAIFSQFFYFFFKPFLNIPIFQQACIVFVCIYMCLSRLLSSLCLYLPTLAYVEIAIGVPSHFLERVCSFLANRVSFSSILFLLSLCSLCLF